MTNIDNIVTVDFAEAISERYLSYALSTIMSRSLPDVRDGLKPVHRRLLYAMLLLKLSPDAAYKKCARVVGDVIGKYHPHSDTAIYDTLVRLAQNFSLRYPLIDGQGNFGSLDGDNAAAMRYTESRLTEIALELMRDLDKNTVDFKPTYDDSDEEPKLLPSAFPNILVNGAEGIAVGMATNIPPHNLHEVCDAMLHMLDNPETPISQLAELIQGPDFPGGGIIVSPKSAISQIYETGKGSVRLRAKWNKESLSHGTYQIIITEIPYQVQKSRLIENIAELFKEKKLPLIDGMRDESAEDVRLIIEPKNRQCDPEIIMESLFKLTDLEIRFHANMNVLSSKNIPEVMNLKRILEEFLNHRKTIVTKRSQFLLDKINNRLEILAGFKIAYLNLDEIIRIIREEDEPKALMMAKFNLTELQAESILNMRLRSLRKLEEIEIQAEYDKLLQEKLELELILSDASKCKKVIKDEIKDLQKRFGYSSKLGARRTNFEEREESSATVINIEAFIEREPITIICSQKGWIRSVKGHITDFSSMKYKEGDEAKFTLHCSTTDQVLIFTESGRFYTILADNFYKGKGDGEPLKLLVNMEHEDEIVNFHIAKPCVRLLLASTKGRGFIVDAMDMVAHTKMGKQVLNVTKPDRALTSVVVNGDMVATIGNNRKLLLFAVNEIPEMKKGQGVILQKFKEASLSDLQIFEKEKGFSWSYGAGKKRTEDNLLPWLARRAAGGKIPPTGFPKDNRF
jgi:topoisomerase-4 subunit A